MASDLQHRSAPEAPKPRRAKHLIDPTAPRTVHTAADEVRLTHVQRWVMSVLAVTTIVHLCVGIAVAAVYLPQSQVGARVGLNLIAMAFGVLAIASGFGIHRRSPLTGWLLLGLVPGLVGLAVVLS